LYPNFPEFRSTVDFPTHNGLPIIGNFKILVIGPPRVGKTSFIQKHLTGEFSHHYTPTTHDQSFIDKFRVTGENTDGIIRLNLVDNVSGEFWNQADATIFMFDLSDINTFLPAVELCCLFQELFPTVPIVFVGNKYDIAPEPDTVDKNFVMSSKTNYGYEKPLINLIRQLMENPTLDFNVIPVAAPPTIIIPPHLEIQLLQELAAAGVSPLPDLPDIDEIGEY